MASFQKEERPNIPFEEIPEEVAHEAMELNYFGVSRIIKHAIKLMEGRKDACIVNVSSGNASQPVGNPYYSSAKGV
jgi:NAD(P)-dependent dehydrogenase (short-subunit alcohol dehydrogenase family)